MKLSIFRSKSKELDDKILALRQERDLCMAHIRSIRSEMEVLLERAADADDLDQKIFSLDYAALRGSLNAESERFQDLSRLISRMLSIQATNSRWQRQEYIDSVRSSIDEAALHREEDEILARRAMIEEEDALNAPSNISPDMDAEVFALDTDFARKLAQVHLRRQEKMCPIRTA